MNNICFVTTPIPELIDDRLEPPLGYLYLSSYLTNTDCGITSSIYDICSVPKDKWDFPEAEYYGFTTYTTTYHRTLEIKDIIKNKYPKGKFIAGGAHASALPKEVLNNFDYVIKGEAERSLWLLLMGRICDRFIDGTSDIITNLDSIPFPDYDLIDVNSYHRLVDGKRSFSILTTRGCPNKCAFCNSIIMGGRNRVRVRSPQNVIDEITQLIEKYGDINIRFQDDMFGVNINWLRDFTKLIKPLDIKYRAFVRASQCKNKEFTDLLYEGGCRHIALGVESGSDVILSAMDKGQTVDDCVKGLQNAKESGLIRRIYLIVGFPGETWNTIEETINMVNITKPDEFVVYPLIPYPGTPISRNAKEYGLINIDQDFSHYFQICGDKKSQFTYDLLYVDRNELQAMKDWLVLELEKNQVIWAKDSAKYV